MPLFSATGLSESTTAGSGSDFRLHAGGRRAQLTGVRGYIVFWALMDGKSLPSPAAVVSPWMNLALGEWSRSSRRSYEGQQPTERTGAFIRKHILWSTVN